MTAPFDQWRVALAARYRIDRELGRGGMAVVYLAKDLRHHRPVAVKVLRGDLAAAIGTERFLREIEIAARLNHPHILPLYDSGEAGGMVYYVMPFVEGESLRDRLERERQLPVDAAVAIVAALGGIRLSLLPLVSGRPSLGSPSARLPFPGVPAAFGERVE